MGRPFDRLAAGMQDLTGDGGVLKRVLQPGEGPVVPRDACVLGCVEYSDQSLEKTYKYPRMMKLGRDVTLVGLELGILTMQKGELAHFILKPDYAYGKMGCPPLIPSSATVLYEVQVADFFDTAKVDEFFELSPYAQNTEPLSTTLDVVNTLRQLGNRLFRQQRFEDGKDRYKQGMTILKNREVGSEEEKRSVDAALVPILLNLSLIYHHLERPTSSLKYGQRALEIDPGNVKALYRCGQAYLQMEDFEKSAEFLLMAQKKSPYNQDINNLLVKLQESYSISLEKEKEMCCKMFANLNKTSRN